MSKKVKLSELVYGAENNDGPFCTYLDKETGKVYTIS